MVDRRSFRIALLALLLACAALASSLLAPTGSLAQGDGDRPDPPELDAAAWILLDARDGERLAARAPASSRAIASTTKLMTAFLALRDLPLDRRLGVPAYPALPAESIAGLVEGERLTVRDLVVAMMLPSANDAAATVATGVSGSEEAFVAEMNAAAAELGLSRTSYANPIGLDDPLNYSTAADLADLTLELRKDRTFREIVAMPEATLRSGSIERVVVTRNTLLLADPSVDGVKTGHTTEAGYVLVASAKREGVPLVSVVLGAASEAARDAETAELLDYGYALYEERSAFRRDEELVARPVSYEDAPLVLLAKRPLPVVAREDQVVDAEVEAPPILEGPIDRGERIGKATVTLDGELVGSVPLIAARAVAEPTWVDRIGGPAVVAGIVALAVVILLAAALVLRRRARG